MKFQMLSGLLAIFVGSASAAIYNYTGSSYAIPDGNPVGTVSSILVNNPDAQITDIKVSLNLSGGYNGDIYAYLSYDGVFMPLLNRVGLGTINGGTVFGSPNSGMNVTLNSTGADVHWASSGGVLTGNFAADGRNINPLSSASSFNANPTLTLDGQFDGLNPNGAWYLFVADLSSGGGTSTLNAWSLEITAVPEMTNLALGVFGGLFTGAKFLQWRRQRNIRVGA